jgi:HlyD family secretion protein
MKTWIFIFVLAALLAMGVFYEHFGSGKPVEVASASFGPIREFIDEEARTRLPRTYQVTMPFAGRIEPIEVVEGTHVKAGQVLARVVQADLDLKVAEAQAAVDRAEASLRENDDTSVESTALQQALRYVESMSRTVEAADEQVKAGQAKRELAEKTWKRMRSLYEQQTTDEQEYNRAEVSKIEADVSYQQDVLLLSALKSLQAATALAPTLVGQYIDRKKLKHDVLLEEKAEAEARLQEAERDRRRGEMTSPIDGVVLERFETNERQVAGGTVLLSVGHLEDLQVEADVLSQDVVNVKPGQATDIYGPAVGPKAAHGEVEQIYPAGFTKTSSLGVEQQRVKVVFRFDADELNDLRAERDLGVGYRVRVRVYTDERSHTLVIPRSALFRGPVGDWQLFAVRDGRARLATVQVGLLNDELVEIRGGLDENEPVILAPETSLVDGTHVSPIKSHVQ